MVNSLKQKIVSKQKTAGTIVNMSDVASSVIIGRCGYDFAWIDLEHGCMDVERALSHVIALQSHGTPVVVRVPENDLTFTKKVLEMGVDGVIFPMVKSAKQANDLIASTLYPPYGTRGFGPQNAIGYGHDDAWGYVKRSKTELCRFIQIEHVSLINELDEVVKNEFIDGFVFGPNDLSGSIGQLGKVFEKDTVDLIKKATERLHAHGKCVGLATGDVSPDTIKFWSDLGIDMLVVGIDYDFIKRVAVWNKNNLDVIHKKNG